MGPVGRHFVYGKSLERSSTPRFLNSAAAQGCRGTSSGFRSEAILFRYFGGMPVFAGPRFGIHHIPDKSGFPSGPLGAGAERLGLPSAVRGIFGCLTFSHCAKAGAADRIPTKSQFVAFIAHLETTDF